MSSTLIDVASNNARPAARMAGEDDMLDRFDTYWVSLASLPAWTNTRWSSGTPSERAFSSEHNSRAAPWLTLLFEFISFVYGKPIMRLRRPGVAMVSASTAFGMAAYGLWDATWLNRAHRSAMWRVWSATDRPAVYRSALSNIG